MSKNRPKPPYEELQGVGKIPLWAIYLLMFLAVAFSIAFWGMMLSSSELPNRLIIATGLLWFIVVLSVAVLPQASMLSRAATWQAIPQPDTVCDIRYAKRESGEYYPASVQLLDRGPWFKVVGDTYADIAIGHTVTCETAIVDDTWHVRNIQRVTAD